MPDCQEIEQIIEDAREKRLQEISVIGSGERPLAGMCPANAIALATQLSNEGYSPQIVAGCFHIDGEPCPSSFERARKRGQQHFWVRIKVRGQELHLDISPEILPPQDYYIGSTPPPEYTVYGEIDYSPQLTEADLQEGSVPSLTG